MIGSFPAGSYKLDVNYGGDIENGVGGASLRFNVGAPKTPSTVFVGSHTPDPPPTGTVSVSGDGKSCQATLPTTSCALSFDTAGSKTLVASYSGDDTYYPSTSAAISHTAAAPASLAQITTRQVGTPVPGGAGGMVTMTIGGIGSGEVQRFEAFLMGLDPRLPPPGSGPANVDFPYGLVGFKVAKLAPGATLSFSIKYPAPLPADARYFKYGPTVDDPNPHGYVLPATIVGDTVTFSIADGGLGDADLAADGSISDPGGIAVPTPASVPPWRPRPRICRIGSAASSAA